MAKSGFSTITIRTEVYEEFKQRFERCKKELSLLGFTNLSSYATHKLLSE